MYRGNNNNIGNNNKNIEKEKLLSSQTPVATYVPQISMGKAMLYSSIMVSVIIIVSLIINIRNQSVRFAQTEAYLLQNIQELSEEINELQISLVYSEYVTEAREFQEFLVNSMLQFLYHLYGHEPRPIGIDWVDLLDSNQIRSYLRAQLWEDLTEIEERLRILNPSLNGGTTE